MEICLRHQRLRLLTNWAGASRDNCSYKYTVQKLELEWYVELYYLPDLISKEKSTIQTTSKYEEKGKEKTIYFRYSPLYILKFALVVKLAIVSLNLVANLGRCEGLVVPACLAIGKHDHAWIVTLDTSLSSLMWSCYQPVLRAKECT